MHTGQLAELTPHAYEPDPISLLIAEHREIEAVALALERFAEAVAGGADIDGVHAFVRYGREFTSGIHHAREEDILLTAAVEEGIFAADILPVTDLLDDHEHSARAIDALAAFASIPVLSPSDRTAFVARARVYTSLVRRHILREDRLFVSIAARLSKASLERVAARFAEHEALHPEAYTALHALAEALTADLRR